MYVEFNEWKGEYNSAKVLKEFNNFHFGEKGITAQDLEQTIQKATLMIKPYRGKTAALEKKKNIAFAIGLAVIVLISAILIAFLSKPT